jgi:hypothetical protein
MPRYDEMRYLSTHNSYSGNISGQRGSMADQLDAGVRCVEFDFHDNGYDDPKIQDYRLGHGLGPGTDVDHSGTNPAGVRLREWLATLSRWSARPANQQHAPITLVLDMWDDLTDNLTGGDPVDLNEELVTAFGNALFTRAEFDMTGQWPDWTALKRRFVCVLSGNPHTRGCYRWDFGSAPALAVNAGGNVVLVFLEESGDAVCWTGTADAAGTVDWLRRSAYERSNVGLREPAVAINDDGWVVSAYRFDRENAPNTIGSRVGHLGEKGKLHWFSTEQFAVGRAPSLAINGNTVTEIHNKAGGGRQRVTGSIDTTSRKIQWGKPRDTPEPRFTVDIAQWGDHTLACTKDPAAEWLGTSFDDATLLPVRFRQIAFVEMQNETELSTLIDPLFFAAIARDKPAIAWSRARVPPLVARAYDFKDGDQTYDPQTSAPWVENMPATDWPSQTFYKRYSQGPGFAL